MKKFILIFLLILVFITNYCLSKFYIGERLPASPDESQSLFFSKLFAENKTLIYLNPLNEMFEDKIFGGRQFVQDNNKTMPSAFLGYIILLSLSRIIGDVNILGPISAMICTLFVYKISIKLFQSENTAIIVSIIFSFLPQMIYWTSSYYNNVTDLAFILAFYHFLMKAKDNKISTLLTVIAVGSFSIYIRYTNILLLLPSVIFFVFANKNLIDKRYILISLIFATVLITPLFIINNFLYGSPFKFGQYGVNQLFYKSLTIDKSIPKEILPLIPFRNYKILVQNLILYQWDLFPMITILSLFSTIYLYRQNKLNSDFILILICIFSWILYYLGGMYSGYGDSSPYLYSSYSRYLLPVFAFEIMLSTWIITKLGGIRIRILYGIYIIFVFTQYLLMSPRSVGNLQYQAKSDGEFVNTVLKGLNKNVVVFTVGLDKIFIQRANVVLYKILCIDDANSCPSKIIKIIDTLIDRDYQIVFIDEENVIANLSIFDFISTINVDKYNILSKVSNNIKYYVIEKR